MPVMPPSIDVYSTADMQALANSLRASAIQGSDYLANQCVAMHPRIVETLRAEGVDGDGRFRWSSSTAEQAAGRIIRPGQKAAEHLAAAATLVTAMYRAWNTHLVVPIEEARRERSRGNARRMTV